MRYALAVLAIAACGSDGKGGDDQAKTCRYRDHDYAIGETWDAGDDCNECTCEASGYTCTARPCQAPPDANPATLCQPMGTCTMGVGCGSTCCNPGEKCVFGTCKCGDNAACGTGDSCEAAGPVGGDACGSICCGMSGPCPN